MVITLLQACLSWAGAGDGHPQCSLSPSLDNSQRSPRFGASFTEGGPGADQRWPEAPGVLRGGHEPLLGTLSSVVDIFSPRRGRALVSRGAVALKTAVSQKLGKVWPRPRGTVETVWTRSSLSDTPSATSLPISLAVRSSRYELLAEWNLVEFTNPCLHRGLPLSMT